MADQNMTFMVEDAQIRWPNFAGREGPFNQSGQKSFTAIIDPEQARIMANDGWFVKEWIPKNAEEGTEPEFHIDVTVKFGEFRPPQVTLISSSGRTQLTDETIEILDWANIQKIDFIARAYFWDVGGKSGVKAYLQTMFVTIEEDDLQRKYGMIESNQGVSSEA